MKSSHQPQSARLPVLEVAGLNVHQGNYLAVQEVSFKLLPGTNTAVVGPNGAGKSTLVQAILGLIPLTAGKVEIFGRPLQRLRMLRHQIGYIPQSFLFDRGFPLSVRELVGLGCRPTGLFRQWPWQPNSVKAAAIAQALERVSAGHLSQQAIGTLSGGELKRVLLAHCLVMPRKLLV